MRAALVGRDVELERVRAVLDAVNVGEGRVMLISGEPGIGKTRLVEELITLAAEQGALVAWGRVDDTDGAPPYWPWLQLLEGLLQALDEQARREALAAGAAVIATVVPSVRRYVDELAALTPLDATAARFRLHAAIVDFLSTVASRQRLVLVIDDVHAADPSSLELMRFVAARVRAAPVLLVATYRTVDSGDSPAFDDVLGSIARHPIERIELGGLSEPEVGQFMTQTIGMRPRPASVSAVHARTEGNPFFVGELARLLHSEGRFVAPPGSDDSAVPVGVRDVVRRRLVRLPDRTNELLVLGAVLGREFDVATVAETADLEHVDVVEALEPALEAGLVNQAAGAMGRLRFSHALIRDTVYGELSRLAQATLHARVGEALEQRRRSTVAELTELALHLFHAAPVLGPARGLPYALEAAQAAQDQLAWEQAAEDLRRALTLVELLPAGRDRLEREILVQNRLATLLTQTVGMSAPETAAAWTRSRQLYTELGDARELLAPVVGLYVVHGTRGDHVITTALGDQLLEVGTAVDDSVLVMAGHNIAGMSSLQRGRLADAQDHLERALTLARHYDAASLLDLFPIHPAGFILELALAYHLLGDETRCAARRAEGNAVYEQIEQPLHRGPGLILDLQLQVSRGDLRTMPEDAATASKLCAKWGLREMSVAAHFWELFALQQRDGQNRSGEMAEALSILDDFGFAVWRTQHVALLAACCHQVGDDDEALRRLDEGLREAARKDERLWQPELLRLRAELLATCDPQRMPEAMRSVDDAVALAHAQGSVILHRRAQQTQAMLREAPGPPIGGAAPAGRPSGLSRRELELLALLGRGLTDKQIAADLVISPSTVRSHLDRIRDKTGRRRRAELTRLAVELGLQTD